MGLGCWLCRSEGRGSGLARTPASPSSPPVLDSAFPPTLVMRGMRGVRSPSSASCRGRGAALCGVWGVASPHTSVGRVMCACLGQSHAMDTVPSITRGRIRCLVYLTKRSSSGRMKIEV